MVGSEVYSSEVKKTEVLMENFRRAIGEGGGGGAWLHGDAWACMGSVHGGNEVLTENFQRAIGEGGGGRKEGCMAAWGQCMWSVNGGNVHGCMEAVHGRMGVLGGAWEPCTRLNGFRLNAGGVSGSDKSFV